MPFDRMCPKRAIGAEARYQQMTRRNVAIVAADQGRRLVALWAGLLFACLWLAGCGSPPLEYTEVKRIDEKLTPSELKTFARIVHRLPRNELVELPRIYLPPPEWDKARTLPIKELVKEEMARLDERWSVDWLARQLQRHRVIDRAIRPEGITREQFVGLTLAIGAALSRAALPEDQRLDRIIEKGERRIDQLREDATPFNSLSLEGMHQILQQALWITRVDRAKRLQMVPPENVELVRQYRELLSPMYPAEFTRNPLSDVVDLLEAYGMPFEELPESGFDGELEWNREDALIGTDVPDGERASAGRGTRFVDRHPSS